MNKVLKYYDSHPVDPSKCYEDTDGFLRVPVVIAKAGVLEYKYQADGGEIVTVREAKLPQELLSKHTIFTSEGKPVTLEHPPVMLDAANYNQYSKGVFINPKVVDGAIHGELVIHDRELRDDIKAGKIYQVSPGFWSSTVYTPGEFGGERYDAIQKDIQFNHIAIVEAGRAGDAVRIKIDSEGIIKLKSEVNKMLTQKDRERMDRYISVVKGEATKDEKAMIQKYFDGLKKRDGLTEEEKSKISEYETAVKPDAETNPEKKEPEPEKKTEEESPMAVELPDDVKQMVEQLKMENELLKKRLSELGQGDSKKTDTSYMEARDTALKLVTDVKLDEYNDSADYYRRAVVNASGLAKADKMSGGQLLGAYEVAKEALRDINSVSGEDFRYDSPKSELETARKESLKMNSAFSGRRVVGGEK